MQLFNQIDAATPEAFDDGEVVAASKQKRKEDESEFEEPIEDYLAPICAKGVSMGTGTFLQR